MTFCRYGPVFFLKRIKAEGRLGNVKSRNPLLDYDQPIRYFVSRLHVVNRHDADLSPGSRAQKIVF